MISRKCKSRNRVLVYAVTKPYPFLSLDLAGHIFQSVGK